MTAAPPNPLAGVPYYRQRDSAQLGRGWAIVADR
jgi:hypothetical protein